MKFVAKFNGGIEKGRLSRGVQRKGRSFYSPFSNQEALRSDFRTRLKKSKFIQQADDLKQTSTGIRKKNEEGRRKAAKTYIINTNINIWFLHTKECEDII